MGRDEIDGSSVNLLHILACGERKSGEARASSEPGPRQRYALGDVNDRFVYFPPRSCLTSAAPDRRSNSPGRRTLMNLSPEQ